MSDDEARRGACVNARWHRRHPFPTDGGEAHRLVWHLAHAACCSCRAMPPADRARVAAFVGEPFTALLADGSALALARVLTAIDACPERLVELAALALDDDPALVAGARAALRRVARERPALAARHAELLREGNHHVRARSVEPRPLGAGR